MLWVIKESRQVQKIIEKAPQQILKKYQFWSSLIQTQGPQAVRFFPGFKDEKLKGNLQAYRSSRLNDQYRVIYKLDEKEGIIYVEKIDTHTYRV